MLWKFLFIANNAIFGMENDRKEMQVLQLQSIFDSKG